MSSLAQTFLSEIEAFLTERRMSATAFGRAAVKDPNFVHDLRGGRLPNLGLVDRVHEYMRSHSAIAEESTA
jgi:2,4-dienoyl-CoA reductase-like NADH-dependent reductase (Old Yellow Enzyme family)